MLSESCTIIDGLISTLLTDVLRILDPSASKLSYLSIEMARYRAVEVLLTKLDAVSRTADFEGEWTSDSLHLRTSQESWAFQSVKVARESVLQYLYLPVDLGFSARTSPSEDRL
jgi:hypothetical protein